MGYYGQLPTDVAMTRASAAAYAALDLDPGLAQAHVAIGICRMFHSWDWIGAEHALRKALELEPRNPTIHMYIGLLQTALGRHEEALASMRRGRELDPLSVLMQMSVAWALYFARQYREALDAIREVTLLDPGFPERPGIPGHHLRAAGPARARRRNARPRERCSSPRAWGKTR